MVYVRVTLNNLNQHFRSYDIELVPGNGYFYFVGRTDMVSDKLNRLDSTSIYVNNLTQLSWDQWVNEMHQILRKADVETMSEGAARYEPPWPLDKLPRRLAEDPVHRWRAVTGIELVHEEPDWNEFVRIQRNWQLMTPEQKKISDAKSIEMFGVDNMTHAEQLKPKMRLKQKNLKEETAFDRTYQKIIKEEEEIEDIFKASTPEEGERRKEKYAEIRLQEWIDSFLKYPQDWHKNPDGSYDSYQSVNLNQLRLKKIPLKFNKCNGFFSCSDNNLTDLAGSPRSVSLSFTCYGNQLTSLEGSPENIGVDFLCSRNKLTTLKGAPKNIVGNFDCRNNNLTTLEGAPREVGGDFDCAFNKKKFTHTEVRAVSNVKGSIHV